MATYPLQASGTIPTCAFIKASGSNTAAVATDGSSSHGDPILGISCEGAQAAPFGSSNDVNAALSGDQFNWHGIGESDVLLTIGSGGCTAGDLLKSDSSGNGITASTDGDNYGAKAQETASAGEKCRVTVLIGQRGA